MIPNMVESCRLESQAGTSGEVTVVPSLAYEATLRSGRTVYQAAGISAGPISGVSQQRKGLHDCLLVRASGLRPRS